MFRWLYSLRRFHSIECLLHALSQEKAPFSLNRKKALKSRVLHQIENRILSEGVEFAQLAEELEKLRLNVEPSPHLKLKHRENLLDVLTLRFQKIRLSELFQNLFSRRRYWATLMAFLVLCVGIFGFSTSFPQVSAAKLNSVEQVSGKVWVERQGFNQFLQSGDYIYEGDLIVTEKDATASLTFVDDSQVILDSLTRVQITQLWQDPLDSSHTQIRLHLEEGRLWAHVSQLSSGALFSLFSGDASFSVDRKATFDLSAFPEGGELRVFDYLVDFEIQEPELTRHGTLGPPLSLLWDQNSDQLLIQSIPHFSELFQIDSWVQANQQANEVHLSSLIHSYQEQIEKQARLLPGDWFYFAKRGGEKMRLFLNPDEELKQNLSFQFARRRFLEAIALAQEGNQEKVDQSLADYQDLLLELAPYQPKPVQSILEESKKLLDGLPSLHLDSLRAKVDEISLLMAENAKSRGAIQLETAADRLGLALEFMQLGAYELAQQALGDYQVQFDAAIDLLVQMDKAPREELILDILDQKLSDLQVLKLIQAELKPLTNQQLPSNEQMQDQLESLQKDTLYQLNATVLHLKDRAVLHLNSFLKDVKEDEALQLQVLSRLKKTVQPSIEIMQLINDLERYYQDDRKEVLFLDEVWDSVNKLPAEDYLENQLESLSLPQEAEVKELAP